MKKLFIRFEEKYFKIFFRNLILFGVLWMMVGFSTGTATLFGPVRWITTYVRNANTNQNSENIIVQSIIVIFILVSVIISVWLTRFVIHHSHNKLKKNIILSACSGITIFSLWIWLNPQSAVQRDSTSFVVNSASFTFGPYPTEEHLLQLKKEGYTDVISLLHPAVIPFEPKLFSDEKKIADSIGLHIMHIPMLPWVSENEDAIKKIKDIAEHGKGKYYIHCYLGRDRINVVKRILEHYNTKIFTDGTQPGRTLNEIQSFERGPITKLGEGIYFIPYPSNEEFLGYIFSGSVKYVVSIMDSSNVENIAWIVKEKKLMNIYQMSFELLCEASFGSLNVKDNNKEKMLKIIKRVSILPKPLVIHDFRSDSPTSKEFIRLYSLEIQK